MNSFTDKEYVKSELYPAFICKICCKKMIGAFKQQDGSFLCAKCLINLTEKNSIIFGLEKSLQSVNLMLSKNRRATKKELKAHKAWIVYLIDQLKKGGNNPKYEGTEKST